MSVAEFSLAGTRFRLVAPAGSPDIRLPDEYAPFLNAPGTDAPDALYTVSPQSADHEAFDSGEVFWDNGLWRMRHVGAHGFDIEINDVQLPGWRRAARVESDFATGVLYPSPLSLDTGFLRPLHHPQDRTIVLGRFCSLGGAMIHSSSVLDEGKAMLFVGMSGAGKTTIARLWRSHGATVLNDERNLVRVRHEAVWVGASPWHGEENQVDPASAPLAAIFFLKQSAANVLRPLTETESVGRLLQATFVPVFIPDGPSKTVDASLAILERVPSYELSFSPDLRAMDLCRSAVSG